MTYWQMAAGFEDRGYWEYFYKYGVACVGGKKNIARFLTDIAKDDILILKEGNKAIRAVGKVLSKPRMAEESSMSNLSGDDLFYHFYGWVLPAYCEVQWRKLASPVEIKGLKWGTFSGVNDEGIKQKAMEILNNVKPIERERMPEPADLIDDKKLLTFLVQEGLSTKTANELRTSIERTRLLADYYFHEYGDEKDGLSWSDLREHEIRSFLVLPFLMAMGWSEQQLKIEFPVQSEGHSTKRIDIACFDKPFSGGNKEPSIIIETKSFGIGLANASEQARAYAAQYPKCRTFIATNGTCYKLFPKRENGSFSDEPSAYLDLLRPRLRYPLDPINCDGAKGVLKALLPKTH